jgi:cation diffusion facilitator CzcD-associated flavoprotein CzcO
MVYNMRADEGALPGHVARPNAATDCNVAIIGSGFGGLGMAIRLKQAGVESFVVLERGDDVGGTWRDNSYPGCACDVPSHLYSFSFELDPGWSRMYASQPEIQGYLRRCADKYGIRPHIRFGANVVAAEYDDAAALWTVRTTDGQELRARVVVAATGGLSRPHVPLLPGIERFRGARFHSAQWDHGYDLRGKRVAVIGTGASAIQFVPRIAPDVAQLDLYQRTPPWILPKSDPAFDDETKAAFRREPGRMRRLRNRVYWINEALATGFTVEPRLMRSVETVARKHLEAQVPDPALRAQLQPDYRIGCKRILLANDYYPALTRDNVELVTSGIADVREASVVTRDGRERPADAIVYGTGFLATEPLAASIFRGSGGVPLGEAWRDGISAYLGITVAGFPNLFLISGPNTGLGHTSVVFMAEAQIHYIMRCLRAMQDRRARAVDVLARAQSRFDRWVQRRMRRTVWTTGCRSWYLDARGVNVTLWPSYTVSYWLRTRRMRTADYRFIQHPNRR